MKKRITHLLIAAAAITLLPSCAAYHYGTMEGSAQLNSANFRYVKQKVYGSAKATYVLGIGGMNRTALVEEARQDLLRKHPLEDGYALTNVTVSFRKHWDIFTASTLCVVGASIVEFTD